MNLSINTDRSSEEWAFLNKGILIKVTESILKFCCRNCLNGKYLHICLFQIFSFYSPECKTLTLTLTLTTTTKKDTTIITTAKENTTTTAIIEKNITKKDIITTTTKKNLTITVTKNITKRSTKKNKEN